MNYYPQTPLPVSRLLDAGFVMFRNVFRDVLPLSALVALVAQLPNFLQGSLTQELQAGQVEGWMLWLIPGWLVWMAIYLALFNGLLKMVDGLGRGEPPLPVGEALQAGLPRVPAAIGTFLLYIIVLMVGTLLLLIPGVLFSMSMIFCWYFVVLEKRGPFEALIDSHRLVWGQWWRTTAVLTIAFIVYLVPVTVIGGIIGVIFAAVSGGTEPAEVAQAMQSITLPLAIVQVIASTLLLPMLLSLMLVTFRDLQLRKSGADLAARAEAA
jgi:hypothetical protein